jgi:predicted hydrocarbon binding protein
MATVNDQQEVAARPAEEKRLMMIWDEKPDTRSLTLLRTEKGPAQIGKEVRIIQGPQTVKHNHYTDAQFFRHEAKKGVLSNVYGQRVVRVSEDFVVALLGGLEDEVGDAAGEIMYKCGYEWGMEDMKSFSRRIQAEFEMEMSKMGMGFMLETWWWPLTIEGWGTWRYDFRQVKQGLIFVDLYESAVAQSIGDVGKVVCYFYAGLFAAVFSVLARRTLGCIEIQCYATGEDYCKFLISSSKRVNAAAFWRNEGATSKDIQKKVLDL